MNNEKKNYNPIFVYGAKILFRNFSGAARPPYDPAGRRTFTLCLPEDLADVLVGDGWYVGRLHAREPGEPDIPKMKVKVNFISTEVANLSKSAGLTNPNPSISLMLNGGNNRVMYNEEMIGDLDRVLFARTQKSVMRYKGVDYVTDLTGTDQYPFYQVDMTLVPYKNPKFNTGFSPYLRTFVGAVVATLVDEVEQKYSEYPVVSPNGLINQ